MNGPRLRPVDPDEPAAVGGGGEASEAAAGVVEAVEEEDGRRQRRRRNREAVIRALLDLIEEGDIDPTVGAIADRAGVSHRSVFRYFDDLNDLGRTAIEQQFRETLPLGVIPGVGTGPFDERVTAIVEARLRVYTRTARLWRVAVVKAPRIPEVERGLQMVNDVLADQVRRHFATELDRLPGDEATAVADALTSLLSFEAYDLQVRLFDRDVDQLRRQWTLAVHRLLASEPDR